MAALTVPPEELKRLKGLGFLSNKNTDNFSARVLTVNGCLTAAQMTVLSQAAEQYGDGHVIFTTRLNAEIPGIPYEKIEDFTKFLNENGMKTGGTGNRIRPIVCCKATTCQFGQLDSFAIARELYEHFYEGYHNLELPYKFKMAVGGCPNNCAKPDLTDLGIMGWRKGYKIFIGGRGGQEACRGAPAFTDHL